MSYRDVEALDIMRSADAEPNSSGAFDGHDGYRLYRVADRSADHDRHYFSANVEESVHRLARRRDQISVEGLSSTSCRFAAITPSGTLIFSVKPSSGYPDRYDRVVIAGSCVLAGDHGAKRGCPVVGCRSMGGVLGTTRELVTVSRRTRRTILGFGERVVRRKTELHAVVNEGLYSRLLQHPMTLSIKVRNG